MLNPESNKEFDVDLEEGGLTEDQRQKLNSITGHYLPKLLDYIEQNKAEQGLVQSVSDLDNLIDKSIEEVVKSNFLISSSKLKNKYKDEQEAFKKVCRSQLLEALTSSDRVEGLDITTLQNIKGNDPKIFSGEIEQAHFFASIPKGQDLGEEQGEAIKKQDIIDKALEFLSNFSSNIWQTIIQTFSINKPDAAEDYLTGTKKLEKQERHSSEQNIFGGKDNKSKLSDIVASVGPSVSDDEKKSGKQKPKKGNIELKSRVDYQFDEQQPPNTSIASNTEAEQVTGKDKEIGV